MTSQLTSQLAITFERLSRAVESSRENRQLLACPFRIPFVESFVHSRNHYCGITCVFARSVDRVPKPGAMREALRDEQRAFGAAQRLIEANRIARRVSLLRQNPGACILKVFCGSGHSTEIESVIS